MGAIVGGMYAAACHEIGTGTAACMGEIAESGFGPDTAEAGNIPCQTEGIGAAGIGVAAARVGNEAGIGAGVSVGRGAGMGVGTEAGTRVGTGAVGTITGIGMGTGTGVTVVGGGVDTGREGTVLVGSGVRQVGALGVTALAGVVLSLGKEEEVGIVPMRTAINNTC